MSGRQIELYEDADGDWRWRLRAANGSDVLADSAEGYVDRGEATAMAAELHPSLPIVNVEGEPQPKQLDDDYEGDREPVEPQES